MRTRLGRAGLVKLELGLVLGFVLLAGGCAWLRPSPRVPTTLASADDVVASVARRRDAVTSLRARARLRAGLAGVWTREAVLVRRPAAVRMDVMSPFGLALALGTNDAVLWLYPPSQGVRYEGSASPDNLARFLGAPVAVEDLVDILLGVPPERQPSGEVTIEAADDLWRLTLPFASGVQQLWVEPSTLDVRRAEEIRDGAVVMRLEFDDYQEGFPHSLAVSSPGTGTSARLAYDTVERNVPLDAALFAPPDVPRVLPLEAAATGG